MKESYEMIATWKLKYFYFTLTILLPVNAESKINESSEEYLRNSMIELQGLNVPATLEDRLSTSIDDKNIIYQNEQSHTVLDPVGSQTVQKYQNQDLERNIVSSIGKVNLHQTNSKLAPQYYQAHAPTVLTMREPESLGFTRNELAAMYKNVLEKGSAISISSLMNALKTGNTPQISETHVEFSSKQPVYRYYFFPLKTFMSEFKKDNGYKTIPTSTTDNTAAATTAQTQLSNPLFVAISTFISMAILFTMSILFLPKLTQFGFHARNIPADFLDLSNIVMNAIERYNLDQFQNHHKTSRRYKNPTRIEKTATKRTISTIVKKKKSERNLHITST